MYLSDTPVIIEMKCKPISQFNVIFIEHAKVKKSREIANLEE